MRSFRHRRGRILFEVFGALLIGTSSAAAWVETGALALVPPALLVTAYGIFRAFTLLAHNPAIRIDDKGIQLGRIMRTSSYRWNQVRDVRVSRWRIEEHLPVKVPSWVPTERDYLELMVEAGALDLGWVKIRADMIELPAGGADELVTMIREMQVAALGTRGAAMSRLGMDPRQQAAAAPRPTGIHAERFARLGIGMEEDVPAEEQAPHQEQPAPQQYVPVRPTFGRKVG